MAEKHDDLLDLPENIRVYLRELKSILQTKEWKAEEKYCLRCARNTTFVIAVKIRAQGVIEESATEEIVKFSIAVKPLDEDGFLGIRCCLECGLADLGKDFMERQLRTCYEVMQQAEARVRLLSDAEQVRVSGLIVPGGSGFNKIKRG